MSVRVRVTKNDLGRIAGILPKATGVIVKKNIEEAALTAQQLAPYDTGELHDSIDARMTSETTGEFFAAAPHAKYPEYGTRDQRPQPYMRPAAEQQRPKFEADMRQLESFLR